MPWKCTLSMIVAWVSKMRLIPLQSRFWLYIRFVNGHCKYAKAFGNRRNIENGDENKKQVKMAERKVKVCKRNIGVYNLCRIAFYVWKLVTCYKEVRNVDYQLLKKSMFLIFRVHFGKKKKCFVKLKKNKSVK